MTAALTPVAPIQEESSPDRVFPRHERLNRRLSQLVLLLTEEWEIEAEDFGSVTLKRSDLGRGIEPDSCFYIAHAAQMRGREAIDLEEGDPAPDLVIEIDVTSPSLPKLPLYAAIGVAEIWRVSPQGIFMILVRNNHDYEEREASQALPTLTVAAVTDLMTRYEQAGRLEWVRQVREWARQNTPAEA